jgi:hypothetical protein
MQGMPNQGPRTSSSCAVSRTDGKQCTGPTFYADLDLHIPENALDATPDILFGMTLEAKAQLKASLTAAHKARLTPDQRAAINLDDIIIDVDAADMATAVRSFDVVRFTNPEGVVHTRSIPHASVRWYSITVGENFSGVVQGAQKATELTSGVAGGFSLKHLTREAAEFSWLKAFYFGACKRVSGTNVENLLPPVHL